MTQRMALCGSTAILLALGNAAHADVTGAEVWNNWKMAMESAGQVVTSGTETQSGDTLTISDLAFGVQTPEIVLSANIGEVTLVDQADGSVVMNFPPSYTMTIVSAEGGADDVEVVLTADQPDLTMTASGGDGTIVYDFDAPSATISVTSLMVDGEAIELDAAVTASAVEGAYSITSGDMPLNESGIAIGSLNLALDMKEPDGGEGSLTANFDYADVLLETSGTALNGSDPEAMMAALAEGANMAGTLTHGAHSFTVDFADRRDSFAANGSADTGLFDFGVSADAISYAVGNTGLDFTVSGSEIPLPEVAASVGEIGFAFLMPASAGDEPKDYSVNITLADLSVSDMIWGMIDPAAQLPRDPATLIIDLAGQAGLLFDLFNPESIMEVDAEIPAEIYSLNINEMILEVAGAALTGAGAFTFDNANLETFDGIPAPTGALDLKLVGANALMDTLVSMGLLPEEQAMGARMMMGLFARPEGDDTLTSKIEIDGASGAVSANGQRLQ